MNAKLKVIFQKLSLFPEYIAVTFRQTLKRLPENDKEIVFTLDDVRLFSDVDGMGRHAYLLLNAFHQSGYNVYLLKSVGFWTYTRLGKYGRYLYELENLKVIPSVPRNCEHMIYAFDTVYPALINQPWKKRTFVNILKDPSCKIGEVVPIPFSMHPIWYRSNEYQKALNLRLTKRTLRVLFGGNTSTEYYSNPYFEKYGQITRAAGLKAAFTVKQIKTLTSKGEAEALLNHTEYLNEGRILSTNDKNVGVENRWLELVAKSDFFLCFSGTDLPMCHNAIESIAVGTIPIISYAHWFFPHLEHMKNAVLYKDAEDLIRKLHDVFVMDNQAIQNLRAGVIEYYDTHLGGKNFVRRYEDQKDKENTVMLYPHYIPRHWEMPKSQTTLDGLKKYFGSTDGRP